MFTKKHLSIGIESKSASLFANLIIANIRQIIYGSINLPTYRNST